MADIFVRSTDGSDADNGSTWALAKATIDGAAAIDAAGDTIYVSDNHAESVSANKTWAFAGTPVNPVRVLCVDDAGDPSPPNALATTGTATQTGGTYTTTITGSVYFYGLGFIGSSGSNRVNYQLHTTTDHIQVFDYCSFNMNNADSYAGVKVGNQGNMHQKVIWKNTNLKYYSTYNWFPINCDFDWLGGACTYSGSFPAQIFSSIGVGDPASSASSPCIVNVNGVDFSGLGSTKNIISTIGAGCKFTMRNCKLPSSWSGTLISATTKVAARAEMWNCSAADHNYDMWIEDYAGSIKHEATIVKTSGASDGVTPLSWKMSSSANAHYLSDVLVSPEVVRWQDATGSSITVTVEVVHDTNGATGQGAGTSYAFQDDEVWLEVEYLGTSGVPLALFASDRKANALATAADQASSSVTWTTTGMTTPVKQKLSVSFTPEEKGYIQAKVCVGKASKTVYVDPALAVN